MIHPIHDALEELGEAIEQITLGSIEAQVIKAAKRELVMCWNDHNPEAPLSEADSLKILEYLE